MPDIYSQEKRSQIMGKISGKDTHPEILVRKHLFAHGFRYRKNVKELPGKPDIVLSKYKTIILVHGCFWHGHSCKKGKLPETRKEFWEEKILKNIALDIKVRVRLESLGWRVILIWQCELSDASKREKHLNKLLEDLRYGSNKYVIPLLPTVL